MRTVTELAALRGWSWAHFRPARTVDGWRTPVSGPLGAGFPDLVLMRDRLMFAELKSDAGKLSPEQRAWSRCAVAAGVEWHVWRPRDFDAIQQVLA